MSEAGKTQEQKISRGKIYTGEGFIADGQSAPRRPRREARGQSDRPRRRSEELREQELKERQEQEAREAREKQEQAARAAQAEKERQRQEAQAEKERQRQEAQAEKERQRQEAQAEKERQRQEAQAEKERQRQEAQAEKERQRQEAQAEKERQRQATQAEREQAAKKVREKKELEAQAVRERKEQTDREAREKQEQAAKKVREKKELEPQAARERKEQAAREAREKQEQAAKKVREKKELEAQAVREKREMEERAAGEKREKERQKKSDDGVRVIGKLAKPQMKRPNRKKQIIGILIGIAAVAYIAVAVYFGLHFYKGTVIYGMDCSYMTVDEVKEMVRQKLSTYTLQIQEREEQTETITADQIHLEYEDDGGIEQVLKAQRSYIWPVTILLKKSQGDTTSFTYDRELATAEINALDCMDSVHMVAPHDAYITPTDTGFAVAAEVMGTTLDGGMVREAVLGALDTGLTSISLEEEDCYVNPQIYQDDEVLQSDAQAKSVLAGASITLDLGSGQEVIDAAKIDNWIVKTSAGAYVIDDIKVAEYVESLAAQYDTFGLPIDFYTSIGTTVTLSGGDYGWCIDQDATLVALLNAMESGYRGTMEPVYLYTGMSHENQGLGYTYVEICISRQEMWCYQDGVLVVDTPVVTGNPNKGNATPAGGVWAIDAKQRNATLVGEGYAAPVDYWMPFNGNIGIHDLQTRYYFGGSIYLSNGSHGCVNTPYEAVQTIYNVVSVGTPVVVYD